MSEPTISLRDVKGRDRLGIPGGFYEGADERCLPVGEWAVALSKEELAAFVEAVEAAVPVLDSLLAAEGNLTDPRCAEVENLQAAVARFSDVGTEASA